MYSLTDGNQIKSLHGHAFQGLKNLKAVLLDKNICINEDFFSEVRIQALPQVVTEKCGSEHNFVVPDFEFLFDSHCGNVSFSTGFVIGGTKTFRGQWPFLVALYNNNEQAFFCGGSLITSQHVLTGLLYKF